MIGPPYGLRIRGDQRITDYSRPGGHLEVARTWQPLPRSRKQKAALAVYTSAADHVKVWCTKPGGKHAVSLPYLRCLALLPRLASSGINILEHGLPERTYLSYLGVKPKLPKKRHLELMKDTGDLDLLDDGTAGVQRRRRGAASLEPVPLDDAGDSDTDEAVEDIIDQEEELVEEEHRLEDEAAADQDLVVPVPTNTQRTRTVVTTLIMSLLILLLLLLIMLLLSL